MNTDKASLLTWKKNNLAQDQECHQVEAKLQFRSTKLRFPQLESLSQNALFGTWKYLKMKN